MKSRHAARELALLTLFQLEKQGTSLAELPKVLRKDLDELILDAVRALVDQAEEQIQDTAKELAELSQYVLNTELEHSDNLATDIEVESKPVPIPTTREMLEKIEQILQGAEYLTEAIRIPELAALSNREEVQAYVFRLIQTLADNLETIDGLLNSCSEDWKVNRMVKIDRDILRLSVAEMKYIDGVDMAVTINEAVELAHQFSMEKSHQFINGILGQVAERLEAEKPISSASVVVTEPDTKPVVEGR